METCTHKLRNFTPAVHAVEQLCGFVAAPSKSVIVSCEDSGKEILHDSVQQAGPHIMD